MTSDESPDVPTHLGDAGGAFYAAATTDYDLSLPEEAALLQVAETLDTLAALEAALREHGPITAGGRPSPLLVEARQQRAILVRLLGVLDLPLDAEDTSRPHLSPSRAASKAAAKRWREHRSPARFR